jgi:DNA-binding winged helix-turn-helix (wHTH) protein
VSSPDSSGRGDRPSGRIWRFGACEFDEPRRDLRVRGVTVDIEVKPLEVLHQLLLHSGEVVTKTELLESVWPGVMVVDGSLATAVSKVRKVLGDDGSVIVTVPRVGYKLAVPVHSEAVSAPIWPDLHLEPGQPVPHREQWRLARRLDLSPSSEVWLAEHPKTREARVFKFALDDARLKGLKREVTVARLLRESLGKRDDFVRVLEWNFEKYPYFIETEYAGPNLAEWAEAEGGIGGVPLDARLKLLTSVAQAVAAAHSLDVLHKDLKPGNILVAPGSDGAVRIKVADFGSASLLVPSRLSAFGITNLGFTQSTAGESLSGTVTYLAPEVLAGQSPTASSDVYALGVLLYQLIVGDSRRSFAPGWEADVDDSLIRDDIAAAASGDPSRRLQTADELVHRLVGLDRRRLAREQAVERKQVEFRRQTRAAARHRWLALAGNRRSRSGGHRRHRQMVVRDSSKDENRCRAAVPARRIRR